MSIQLLKKPLKKNLIIGITTAFVLVLIGVGYTANIKANERKKLEEACTSNENADDCQKACDAGSAKGCSNLGLLYVLGQGVEQDDTKAAQFYKKACDGGNAGACKNLALLYMNIDGEGVEQDYAKAAQFFEKACDGGETGACSSLGILYIGLDGFKKDLTKATHYLQKGCDGGIAMACGALRQVQELE